MKKFQALIFALALTFIAGNCFAQSPDDDRLFGNGRFLKRLRNRISGKDMNPKPKSATKDSKKKADTKKADAKKADSKKKSSSELAKKSETSAARDIAKSKSTERAKFKLPEPVKAPTPKARPKTIVLKSPHSGFGLRVKAKGDRLIVSEVIKDGNAAEAGIEKGDQIVAAGGVPIENADEIKQIGELLKNGDQIEFEVLRKKETNKILVAYTRSDAPAGTELQPISATPFVPAPDLADEPAPMWSPSDEIYANKEPGIIQPPDFVEAPSIVEAPNLLEPNSNEIIQKQRAEIQRMKEELERLRNEAILESSELVPSSNPNLGQSILETPIIETPAIEPPEINGPEIEAPK